MAEANILDIFPGARRDLCNAVLSQVQDAVVWLDKDRKIVYWNKAAEEISGREAAGVLGRACFEEPTLFVDYAGIDICRDKCPVAMTLKDGAPRTLDVYLQHKEGFRTPASLRIIPVFKEDGDILGAVETFSGTAPKVTLPLALTELEKMGLVESETGIPSKQYLDMTLATRLEEFQKYNLTFGLVYVDIDNYGKILERYGRFNASKIVRTVARTLYKNIRFFDIVGRWSTEEFLVLLLNIDEGRLDIVANKLRLLVAESYITTETGMLNATVSMGASLVLRYDTVESLVKRGEQLMLHSKWLGKNRVSMSFVQKDMV
ncbi:MAG TPA: sensor domain-containing diguanylate cyclase [Candidatus Aminicenantes bacterium]|nr:sensor domain-containing diguanylate cyclase [Candidatus Aminicenantes bacterium]HRY65816.1 sensor domain-containing diguanylate cyclase [Candidatus Aminicenantes bacterium]HRZ72730.1 sensor domain-containing diguanylate cyclase [Candidatus Aminicenantes bacterium]